MRFRVGFDWNEIGIGIIVGRDGDWDYIGMGLRLEYRSE